MEQGIKTNWIAFPRVNLLHNAQVLVISSVLMLMALAVKSIVGYSGYVVHFLAIYMAVNLVLGTIYLAILKLRKFHVRFIDPGYSCDLLSVVLFGAACGLYSYVISTEVGVIYGLVYFSSLALNLCVTFDWMKIYNGEET